MMRLSRPASERLQRTAVTGILILGAVPIALPFCWLILASLKTADRVLTDRPEWLPWVDRYTLDDGRQEWSLTILDRSREGLLGWWRVRPANLPNEDYFLWPLDQIETRAVTGYVARIGWLKRAVTAPQPADRPGWVRVGQLGTQQVVAVGPGQLREESHIEHVAVVLGQEVVVELESPPTGETDPAWQNSPSGPGTSLRIKDYSLPFELADSQVRGSDHGPQVWVESLGAALPVEVLEHYPSSGVSRVRLVPGQVVLSDPGRVRVERRLTVRYYLEQEDGPVEVKPTRRDEQGNPVEVALLTRPREWIVPASHVTPATGYEQRIRWLDQSLTVRSRGDVATPAGMAALQPVWPADSVVVAAERVRHQRRLEAQWSNYINVFAAEPLHKYVLNTLFITVLCIVGNVLSCGLVGYAFARLRFRGRDGLFLIVLATMMLPSTITFLPTYILYVKIGWLDSFYPLIVPSFLATAAFFVFLYRQFFLTIPLDLEDAARIDGCGPLGTFWHLMLPAARPAVVTVAVFTFMASWNDFMGPLLYLNTDEYQTLAYGLFSFKTSFGYKFPHFMMAASAMMMIPTLAIFFLAQRAFMRGVVVTGVKG